MEDGALQAGLEDRETLADGLFTDAGAAQIAGEVIDQGGS